MFWDTHIHCHFSGDSDAAPEAMIYAAQEKNLDGICFTDHLDYDYKEDPKLFLLDVDAYQKEIASLKELYRNKFPILWGIELGLQPQVAEKNNRITTAYPFDFVIGSSHVVNGCDPYYPDYFEGRPEEEAFIEYFESILANIHTDTDYDVYGHLDYVVRYAPNQDRFYSYKRFADIIDEILRTLISQGKGIELNTGSFKYGVFQPNPCEDILARYRQLGGEIITLGSDAHKPADVAHSFGYIFDILKRAGFQYFTVYEARQPKFKKLTDIE